MNNKTLFRMFSPVVLILAFLSMAALPVSAGGRVEKDLDGRVISVTPTNPLVGEPIDEAVFRAMKPNTVFSQNQSPNASAHPKPPEANAAPTTSSVRTALPDASTTMRGTRMKVISYKIDGQEYADRIAYVDIDWPNRDQDTSVYNLMMTIYQNDGKTGTFAFLRGDARDRMWRFDAYGWMSIWQAEGDLIWAIEDKKLFMPEVLTIDNAFWGKDWASPNRLIFSDRDDDYTIRIMIELDGPVFTR